MTEANVGQRLLLIDGLNIVRRVYGAVPGDDSDEKAEGAIKSSMGTLRRVLREQKPTHALIAFDHGGHTWRHDLLSTYKCNRKPMPEPLAALMPTFKEMVQQQLGLFQLTFPGVEAEDVLATVSRHWLIRGRGDVVVTSTDKDVASLVCQGAKVKNPFQDVWHDETWIREKFRVAPEQLLDLLALMGDPVDDIPGVPGVAVGKGAQLLTTYGTLNAVLEQANSVKGKLGENLRASLDAVRLARRLVALRDDLTLGLTWNQLMYAG